MTDRDKNRTYLAIDLKSYYASVECASMGLDPLTTNLVVADASRTEKTICLAVSPSLKAYGIPGRARLFEVVEAVKKVNQERLRKAGQLGLLQKDQRGIYHFSSSSSDAKALAADPALELSYIIAPPRMRKYMEISSSIYQIYLRYVSPDDIHVYSIDECFIDVTDYLKLYKTTARELCMTMIRDVLKETGITATGGIGTNLFLAKAAMDIVAKHVPADQNGVRIAELDERSFRQTLWAHEPITDFWRIGKGTARKLAANHIYTMGDIARCSIGLPPIETSDPIPHAFERDGRCSEPDHFFNEDLLYRLLGVNAELLIDHAWGYEPTTIRQIKSYQPENNSLTSAQVLAEPYDYEKAKTIIKEMTDLLVLDLVRKELCTDQIVLSIGYDIDNRNYNGALMKDRYGRNVPKPAHGSVNLGKHTSSTERIISKTLALYEQITDPSLFVRRINLSANHVVPESQVLTQAVYEQLDLFTDYATLNQKHKSEREKDAKEKNMQKAILAIQGKYGKNALLRGTDLTEGATTRERNNQVGGHNG